jgi:hypothetical protein
MKELMRTHIPKRTRSLPFKMHKTKGVPMLPPAGNMSKAYSTMNKEVSSEEVKM